MCIQTRAAGVAAMYSILDWQRLELKSYRYAVHTENSLPGKLCCKQRCGLHCSLTANSQGLLSVVGGIAEKGCNTVKQQKTLYMLAALHEGINTIVGANAALATQKGQALHLAVAQPCYHCILSL